MGAFTGILPYGRLLTNRVTNKALQPDLLSRIQTDILLGRIKADDVTREWFEELQDWDKFLAWK